MASRLEFGIQIARQTGQLLLEYFHSSDLQAHMKKDHSVVTEADLAADRFIAESIQKQYPNDEILSEELQTALEGTAGGPSTTVWVVDPLDGTTNFSLGLHYWGVSLACLKDGQPETAVLYFPCIDELYSAQKRRGAYFNDQPLHVNTFEASSLQPFFACCSRTYRKYRVTLPYKIRILGSAAYTFCAVSRGIAILGFEATPKIWDLAAAWLVVQEAGGVIETHHSSWPFPLQAGLDYTRKSFPTLAAANQSLLDKGRQHIIPKKP
jgi:myo-inositol-1(or 4)-monophosphatase